MSANLSRNRSETLKPSKSPEISVNKLFALDVCSLNKFRRSQCRMTKNKLLSFEIKFLLLLKVLSETTKNITITSISSP